MNDTPQHIYDLRLKLWPAKSPGERLRQLMIDNDALFKFWREAKTVAVENKTNKILITKEMIYGNIPSST